MIPAQNIVAWGSLVPWTDARQIEQDRLPGEPWGRTVPMKQRFGIAG